MVRPITKISKLDDSFLIVDGAIDILAQIKDHFSYKIKGAEYSQAYKSRRWDGKIYLFDINRRTLYLGLYDLLIDFLKTNNIDYESDYKQTLEDIDIKSLVEYLVSLNLPFKPRNYQVYGILKALEAKRGIIKSATSCHPKGTRIILEDGTLKPVEAIVKGDKVLGLKNYPREVIQTHLGVSEIYKITSSDKNKRYHFDDFYVNENHILSLVNIRTVKYTEISVKDYLKSSLKFKKENKLFQNFHPLKFKNNYPEATEEEITDSLIKDNTIPKSLRTGSVKTRLSFLRILRDKFSFSDGEYFVYTTSEFKKIKAIEFIVKSLNIRCIVSTKYISSDMFHQIQILEDDLENFKDDNEVSIRFFNFEVYFDRIDTFYGFTLKGDPRYYLENFIVNHNSGKSLIQYGITRYLLREGKSVLIIVPKVSLVEQMFEDFRDYNYDVDENVYKIYSGKNGFTQKPVVITTYQSLKNIKPKLLKKFGAVLVDECHGATNNTLKKFLVGMRNCEYKLGFTGTLKTEESEINLLKGLFGNVHEIITSKELIEKGYSPKLTIEAKILKHKKRNFDSYQDEINHICENERRNEYIRDLCSSLNGNTIILFNLIDSHGKKIYEAIKDLNKEIYFIYGGTDVEDRENIRKIMEKKNNVIICASLGVYSTGVNIKNLHNIILASSTKSKVLNLQSIGRALRKHISKNSVCIYDLVDDYSGGRKKKNYTFRHFEERKKYYKDENFVCNISTIDISSP